MAQSGSQRTPAGIASPDEILDGGRMPESGRYKRVIEAVRESEERFRALVQAFDDVVWLVDLPAAASAHEDATVLPFSFVSPQAEATLGYPVERWLAERDFWINHIHPDDRERMRDHCRQAAAEPHEHQEEYRMVAADGRLLWIRDRVRLVRDASGLPLQMCGLMEDITERKQAEIALGESEERFHTLAKVSPVGIFRTDAEGHYLYVNERWCEIAGISAPEARGEGWARGLHPDDRERVVAERYRAVRERATFRGEYRFRRPDGVTTWVFGQAVAERGAAGEVVGYVGTITDITERKQAEDTLRESEARYHTLARVSPVGIFRTDAAGHCLYVNERWCEIAGVTADEAYGGGWARCLHPDDRNHVVAGWYTAVKTGAPFRAECRFRRPDGGTTWVLGQALAENGPGGNVLSYVGTITDITERKQAEEELSRSREELRALSARLQRVREEERTRIAREIHDELGQTLTGLKMDLAWLQKRVARSRPPREALEKIASMSQLVDTTIESVHKIASDLRPTMLDDLGLAAAIEWQAQDFETRTGIRCELTPGLDAAAQDASMNRDVSTGLFRILQESLTNVARHARASRVRIALRQRADELTLEVADDGRGITEAERLDPSSLGLLGMRERARQLGGQVTIVGVPGQGTTVTVRVPLAQTKGR